MNAAKGGRIVFLSVPESLRGTVEPGGDFAIDPSIPIPVELAPGVRDLDLEQLSWEMILAGMIRVIAEEGGDEDADYYRRFVLTVKPHILEQFAEAAAVKAANGDYETALEIMAALEGLFPGKPELLLARALIREKRADAFLNSGREAEGEQENQAALGAYRELLALDPPFPNGLFNAGFFFMKLRDFGQARDCFSAYLPLAKDPLKEKKAAALIREIKSRSLDAADFRDAYDLIRRGQEEQGLPLIRDFLEAHPQVWNGWFLLGWALRRLGRWQDAEAAFTKALDLGGENGDTRNERAICFMELGDYRAARKELERALRQEPENVKIISNLAVLSLKSGNNAEAAGFFRTILELDPQDPLAREYLSRSRDS